MGSSGMKRKGRKHLPKVGTAPEREYALHHEQEAVLGNFGISGRGWVFWTATGVVALIVLGAVFSLALWF